MLTTGKENGMKPSTKRRGREGKPITENVYGKDDETGHERNEKIVYARLRVTREREGGGLLTGTGGEGECRKYIQVEKGYTGNRKIRLVYREGKWNKDKGELDQKQDNVRKTENGFKGEI